MKDSRSRLRPVVVGVALIALLAALTAGLVIGLASDDDPAGAVDAAPGAPSDPMLFGSADPTFDGVYRQSLAILGLHAAEQPAEPAAYRWLADQQCESGAFPAYRTSTEGDCADYDPETSTGGADSNATAAAAQALSTSPEADQRAAGADASRWLQETQQDDGGWEYTPGAGFGSDPNSTALALMALDAAGLDPVHDATAYLAELQVGRTVAALADADLGGITTAFSEGAPNVLASVQVLPAVLGVNLVEPAAPADWADAPRQVGTDGTAADAAGVGAWAAAWVAAQVQAGSVEGGDLFWAALGLAADGSGREVATTGYEKLRDSVAETPDDPAALAHAVLAAKLVGDQDAVGELAAKIAATGTADSRADGATPATTDAG